MSWSTARRIASKELTLFFASPIGYLFLASFLAVTLFVFFWGEAYFARNIADVRPMFECTLTSVSPSSSSSSSD